MADRALEPLRGYCALGSGDVRDAAEHLKGCRLPGSCDQPAAGREAHHVVHRGDGGRTGLLNIKDFCPWHHHVMLHQLAWVLTVYPDGTSQAPQPGGQGHKKPQPAAPSRLTRLARP